MPQLQVKWPQACYEGAAVWSEALRKQAVETMVCGGIEGWLSASDSVSLQSRISQKDINARRSALLVPEDVLSPLPTDARIPVMLVQQPGLVVAEGDG